MREAWQQGLPEQQAGRVVMHKEGTLRHIVHQIIVHGPSRMVGGLDATVAGPGTQQEHQIAIDGANQGIQNLTGMTRSAVDGGLYRLKPKH